MSEETDAAALAANWNASRGEGDRALGPELTAEGWIVIGGDTIIWLHPPTRQVVKLDGPWQWNRTSGIPALEGAPADPETEGYLVELCISDGNGNPVKADTYWTPSYGKALKGVRALRASVLAKAEATLPPKIGDRQPALFDLESLPRVPQPWVRRILFVDYFGVLATRASVKAFQAKWEAARKPGPCMDCGLPLPPVGVSPVGKKLCFCHVSVHGFQRDITKDILVRPPPDNSELLVPACVQRLNELVARARAEVVGTTPWNCDKPAELTAQLRRAGGDFNVLDLALVHHVFGEEDEDDSDLGRGILAWLARNVADVGAYAVLVAAPGDEPGYEIGLLDARAVRTDPKVGLSDADVDKALALLELPR